SHTGASRRWTPARRPGSVEIRHRQRDGDLIFLPVERRQRGPVVSDLGPHDGAGPRLDVQRRGRAAELLPGVRLEAEDAARACAVLVVHVIAAQRQTGGGAEVVRDPAAECPPLRVLRRIGQCRVRLLRAVIALDPDGRLAELAPQQALNPYRLALLFPGSSAPQYPT